MITAYRGTSRRATTLAVALAALAATFVLTPSTSEAAQTYTVAYGSIGSDRVRDLSVRKGDVVVFRNDLPKVPLTGAIAPVEMTFGDENFTVAETPVSRTITASVAYTGTYTVLGLIDTTTEGGTITAANDPPPPGGGGAPPGGGSVNPPPSGGGSGSGNPLSTTPGGTTPGGTTPGGVTPGGTTPGGYRPNIRAGDPGYVPGGAGTANGPHPDGSTISGQSRTGSDGVLARGAEKQPAAIGTRLTAGGLGLLALFGAVLLLGVGIALARTLTSGRLNSMATA